MALLPGHRLKFHKKGRDGSAKCGIERTRDPADRVYGVVFDFHAREKIQLDLYEGLGNGYEEKPVSVQLPDGGSIEAFTYYPTHIDTSLQPYHWYKEHVLRGAREHGLPDHYIKRIESVASIADPDTDNHTNELSIYSSSIEEAAF